MATIIDKLADKFQRIKQQTVAPALQQKWQAMSKRFGELKDPEIPPLNLAERFSEFTQVNQPAVRWQDSWQKFVGDRPQRIAETQARIGYSLSSLGNRFRDFMSTAPTELNTRGQAYLNLRPEPKGTIPRLGFNLARGLAKNMLETATIGSPETREYNLLATKTNRTPAEDERMKDIFLKQNMDLVMGFVGPAPTTKLSHLIGYSDELVGRGFKINQVEKIGNNEARQILANNITPADWAAGKVKEFGSFVKGNVKDKVNLLDYVRTPDRVMAKLGLGNEAKLLRNSYDNYIGELPQHIDKITEWSKRVPGAGQRIFRWLDGQAVTLTPVEQQVGSEVKTYLKDWAVRLKLPGEKRITNYITHLFERGDIESEFSPEIAKAIEGKIPGSVYNPFLQKRTGVQGYIEDAWRALDAYAKRASRKVNLDPALEQIKARAKDLDLESEKWLVNYTSRINLRPTDIDNLIDNAIKSSPVGYKFTGRPTTYLSQKVRQWVYRGTLGGNIGSALKNLTQGANTYAKLGEKYTLKGYLQTFRELANGGTELVREGVLHDRFISDRAPSVYRGLTQKLDEGLFYMFDQAERINRGAAYFGAKTKALDKGLDERAAIEYAKKIVRDTQFTFGSIDTPLVLSSDIAKTLLQFQSFNIKQLEFLTEMVKAKDFAGLIRWTGATLLVMKTVGKLWDMDFADIIPSIKVGSTPTIQAIQGAWQMGSGEERTREKGLDKLTRSLVAHIPGGVQARKTIQGAELLAAGGSFTDTGRLRFPAPDTLGGQVRAVLFGPWTSEESKKYYDSNLGPMSESQTTKYQSMLKAGIDNDRALAVVNAQRIADKTKAEELKVLNDPAERQSIRNIAAYQISGIKQGLATGDYSPPATGSLELDALLRAEQVKQERSEFRTFIIDPYLSEPEKRQIISSRGGDYDVKVSRLMAGLTVADRAEYSLAKIKQSDSPMATALALSQNKILTKSVIDYWLDTGELSADQAGYMNNLVYTAIGKIKVKKIKTKKLKPLIAPKLVKTSRVVPPRISLPGYEVLKPVEFKVNRYRR